MTGERSPRIQQSLKDTMTFRKDWRAYQSRLLEHLDRYLGDVLPRLKPGASQSTAALLHHG